MICKFFQGILAKETFREETSLLLGRVLTKKSHSFGQFHSFVFFLAWGLNERHGQESSEGWLLLGVCVASSLSLRGSASLGALGRGRLGPPRLPLGLPPPVLSPASDPATDLFSTPDGPGTRKQ